MKKLLLILTVLACGIGQVRAAKLYVNVGSNSWWSTLRVYAFGDGEGNNNGWNNKDAGIATTVTRFGKTWYVYDFAETTYHTAVVQQGAVDGSTFKVYNKTFNITGLGTVDKYVVLTTENTEEANQWYNDNSEKKGQYSYMYFDTPVVRNNSESNWSSTTSNMTAEDEYTFTYSRTKSEIDAIGDTDFRFRVCDFGTQIYPTSSSVQIDIAGNTSTYTNDGNSTDNYFYVAKPAYDYEKIVITVSYNTSTTKWTISADAYITHSLTYDYATYSVAAPLDFSKATGVKGFYASSFDASKVTFTKIDGTCAANTGLLLAKDGTDPVSIPVASSGTDYSSSNKLKHGTGAGVISDGSYNRYVLARNKTSGDIHFAKLTSSSEVSVGKAYLEVAASSAPSLSIVFDGEDDMTTGINASLNDKAEMINDNAIYNLAGQRVSKPTKGLYIVNGRKVVVK